MYNMYNTVLPVQVGGLADVVTSLAKAHQATGTLCEIVLPKYDCIQYHDVAELRCGVDFPLPGGLGVSQGYPVLLLTWLFDAGK